MIDKVTIAVGDMDGMVAFYAAVLGVEFEEQELFERRLNSAHFRDVEILLCPKDLAGVDATINTVQVRFLVYDVAASYEAGVACGGAPITEPQELSGDRLASLRDPDGNSVELKEIVPD